MIRRASTDVSGGEPRSDASQSAEGRIPGGATAGAWLALAGVFGFTVCLLARYAAALPRWDLLAMLAVACLGAALRALALRRPVRREPAGCGSASLRPQGFAAEPAAGWPDRKRQRTAVLFWLCTVPVVVLAGSAAQTTGPENRVRGAASTAVAEVTVLRVDTTRVSTAQRTFRIRANTKPDGSGRYLEGTIAHAHKRVSVHYRDEVWARYRTDVASGDAIMALSRGELEERSGGWSRSPEPLLLALVPAGVAGARWWWVRTRRSDRAGRGPVAAAVHNGRARALRVRVSGHRKSAFNKGRVLVLTSLRGGERELLLERWVDTDRVAETLSGCEGWLYWEPRAVRGPSPSSAGVQHDDAPRSLGPRMRDSGRPALDSAVFVLADGSALRGRTPSVPPDSMPEGERVPRLPAERCPQVRPLDGRVLRRPRLRLTALLAGLPGAAVLLAMLVVPLGDPEQVWSMRLMLLAAAVLIPCFVHNRLAGRAWARR